MFPAKFDYVAPTSLDEALSLVNERSGEARVLAGGQSLIPLMKLRFATPELIVDLNRIPDLDYIDESGDPLRIGALARNSEIVDSEPIREGYPAIAAAAPLISDPLVRNLGTMAGSLAHCDPAGDWGSVVLALGGEVVAQSAGSERTIPIDDLLEGPFTTALEPNEILTEVRIPQPAGNAGSAYLKLERKVGDFATVGAAVALELSNGQVSRAGIALTAVGPKNVRAEAAEDALAGAEPGADAFEEAGRLAAEAAEPRSDERGSAVYKRELARELVTRGLGQAHELAGAG